MPRSQHILGHPTLQPGLASLFVKKIGMASLFVKMLGMASLFVKNPSNYMQRDTLVKVVYSADRSFSALIAQGTDTPSTSSALVAIPACVGTMF